ncbi:hypothetical protein [Nostoc sp.]|uniref:hypothetical protein n=1 Tax=Nostoc sp. TaxID=1180 RepID=UPI002FF5250B
MPDWSAIFYRKSLQEFLSQENQLSAIKDFFLKSINELKNIQPDFNFPWKGVSIETVTEVDKEKDPDTSPPSITQL